MPPSTIPIFPLPTVVLFPNVFLPLHIFEPRYRQMVTEALAGDRIIGMTLLAVRGRCRGRRSRRSTPSAARASSRTSSGSPTGDST